MPRPEVVAMRLPPTLVAVAVSPTVAASPTAALPAAVVATPVAVRLPPTLAVVAVSPTAAASPTGALPTAAALRVVAPEGIPLWQRRVPGVAVQRAVSLSRAAPVATSAGLALLTRAPRAALTIRPKPRSRAPRARAPRARAPWG